MKGRTRRLPLVVLAVAAAVTLAVGPASGQDEASTVAALLRDLKSSEFQEVHGAAQALASHPRYRAQIVPALVEVLRTRDWPRCAGDARDAMARTLVELKAKEAVVPLLELLKSGKPIDHECVE